MYVDVAYSKQHGKTYKRTLLRHNYKEKGKVKHKTIANISKCTDEEIEAIKLALKHKGDLSKVGSFKDNVESKQGLSVGAIVLLKTLADRLHITRALGESTEGKLALWQIMARIIEQGSRLSSVRLAQSHAVFDLLNLGFFTEDDLYENLDWLCNNQEQIEKRLFTMRYKNKEVPRLFLYDVTSSYLEGVENDLADWGYNRDGKKGKLQIVIGLLTDDEGVPVSVEVFQGNTTDPETFLNQIKKIADRFAVQEVTMVGDRGMIKSTQIEQLKAEHFNYITAITKPQIQRLLNTGALQIELFNEKICEVISDDIRYILRRNPLGEQQIQDNRQEKINQVQEVIKEQNEYLSAHARAKVSVAKTKIERLLEKLKLSQFAEVQAQKRQLSLKIDEKKKEEATKLDGCYVIKTELKEEVSSETIHQRYKDLAVVEQGFRTMKTALLEARPVFVRKEKRTRGHIFVVMLAYILIYELQKSWAHIDLTVQEGITELTTIDSLEIKIGEISYHQIPKPRDKGAALLKSANVTLPMAIVSDNINVATKRKLPSRRKVTTSK